MTDLFDGIIARRQKQITSFGKLIDPLADKLIISAAFILFIGIEGLEIPVWAIVLIILRGIVITDLRDFTNYKGMVIVVSKAGKCKTTFQLVGVIVILMITIIKKILSDVFVLKIPVFINVILERFPYYIIILIMLLTIYSGIKYILMNRCILFPKNQ